MKFVLGVIVGVVFSRPIRDFVNKQIDNKHDSILYYRDQLVTRLDNIYSD